METSLLMVVAIAIIIIALCLSGKNGVLKILPFWRNALGLAAGAMIALLLIKCLMSGQGVFGLSLGLTFGLSLSLMLILVILIDGGALKVILKK